MQCKTIVVEIELSPPYFALSYCIYLSFKDDHKMTWLEKRNAKLPGELAGTWQIRITAAN